MNLARFSALMSLIRCRGAKIFWIAHNLYPHNGGKAVRAHRVGRRVMVALSSWIGAHSDAAATRIREEFGVSKRSIVRLEHGNWVGLYPNEMSREEARRRLAIAQGAFVFLFIGLCKEYKNLVHLVRSHKEVQGDSNLWIAGLFQSQTYFDEVQAAVSGSERITVRNGRVPSHDMQIYLNACDVVVLPYKEILTSGAAMLALSFGRPVLAPRLPSLVELISGDCGLLYDPVADHALTEAMGAVRSQRFDPARIVSHALEFSWQRSAQSFVRAICSSGSR
jgi:glycosyltransferase involved in cell wall biosynthesis